MPKSHLARPIVARQVQGGEPVKSRRRKAAAKSSTSANPTPAANGVKRKLEVVVGFNKGPQQQPQKRAKSEGADAVEVPKPRDPNALLFCKGVVDRQAVNCLQRLMEAQLSKTKGASLKSLTMGANITAKKAVYAVTVEVLKYMPILRRLTEAVGLSGHGARMSAATAFVLVYEMLFGEGLHQARGPAEHVVNGKKNVEDLLASSMETEGAPSSNIVVPHYRWARVNLLKATVEAAIQRMRDMPAKTGAPKSTGEQLVYNSASKLADATSLCHSWTPNVVEVVTREWEDGKPPRGSTGGQLVSAAQAHPCVPGCGGRRLCANSAEIDALLPDLLRFPTGTDIHDHPLVAEGVLVLQSKASCLPAHALNPQAAWTVLDCCAAPGNKTTHIAALMAGEGKIIAVDRDLKRLGRLKANAAATGATSIVARHGDFLAIDTASEDFAHVCGVLLDPSCSGSGTASSRTDKLLEMATKGLHLGTSKAAAAGAAAAADDEGEEGDSEGGDAARVAQLAKFQVMALRKALTFPALQRLVYSTCSIHQAENEDVVAEVLDDARAAGFDLVDPFPSWHRRGLPLFVGSEKLVRTDATLDGTDGFFVAVFQKTSATPPPTRPAPKALVKTKPTASTAAAAKPAPSTSKPSSAAPSKKPHTASPATASADKSKSKPPSSSSKPPMSKGGKPSTSGGSKPPTSKVGEESGAAPESKRKVREAPATTGKFHKSNKRPFSGNKPGSLPARGTVPSPSLAGKGKGKKAGKPEGGGEGTFFRKKMSSGGVKKPGHKKTGN
ncbi:MAG: hypothetical protein WDW38_008854 [Sanguina aurantia]